jgi:predicted Zn-dependent protease
LIVDPDRVTTIEALRAGLLAEVRRAGLPFGLRVSRVMGGVAQTTAGDPQAFQLDPVLVYRVYPDGREELIRGVTLEGTPLSVLASLIGAANDYAVFNGLCGAESGELPVAAVSPSLLLSRLELARAGTVTARPPLLAPPVAGEAK